MILGRRTFGKAMLGTATAWLFMASVSGVAFLTGCAAETVAQAIVMSFGKVLQLLQSSGIITSEPLVNAATAALNAFSDAFNAYEKNKTQGTLTALGAAAQQALTDVQAFLSQTNIGGPIALVVTTLLEIIISTLTSFLPAPKPMMIRLNNKETSVVPVKRSKAQYIGDWNAACVKAGHSELKIK